MDWLGIAESALQSAVGRNAIIYAIAAIGLNLHFGYTGLLNFGHVGFMAVGAYGVAIGVNHVGLPLWGGALAALVVSGCLALLLGIPTLRLRAEYLAIVTIAVGEIFRTLVQAPAWRSVTGGATGQGGFSDGFFDLNPVPDGTYGFGPWHYSERSTWILLSGWAVVALAVVFVALLTRSPWGRVLRAVREDEDAARSLGKNAYGYKLQSLVVGGAIGTVAGIFWAVTQNSVTPGNFRPETTFFVYVALFLGGAARALGPVVGSILLWVLISVTEGVLSQAVDAGHIPPVVMDGAQVGQVRMMLVGLGMAALVVYRPQGILGDRREVALEVG